MAEHLLDQVELEQTPWEVLNYDAGLPQPSQNRKDVLYKSDEPPRRIRRALGLTRGVDSLTNTLNIARNELGTVESPPNSNNVKYGIWYGMNRQPWCAMYVSWVLAQAGLGSQYRHASVAESLARARKNGRHTGEFRPGYVVCRINNGSWTGPGHTGIIEVEHSDGSVTTIEGNTSPGSSGSQRDGGGCWRRRRPKSYWNRQCIRIDYKTSAPPPPPPPPPPRWGKYLSPMVGAFYQPQGDSEVKTGMYIVGADGGVFTLGSGAQFHGSTGGLILNRPVVGGAVHPSGNGYWLVADDGGVFAFGAAGFFGSTAGVRLIKPVVGMAATPSGNGYWLVGGDGGIFNYGDAPFLGSVAQYPLHRPIIGICATKSGKGYFLLGEDGGVFALGDAVYSDSAVTRVGHRRAVSMALTDTEKGYWILCDDGHIINCGDAPDWRIPGGNPFKPTHLLKGLNGLLVVFEDGSVYTGGPGPTEFWGSIA